MNDKYIVASSKLWHLEIFKKISQNEVNKWVYVATPDDLDLAVRTTAPRYIFFLHWNWQVPREIWSKHECVCFHMTDLPFGRGGSPLQNLILAGVRETKVTALRMVEEIDAGPVYAKRTMSLEGRAEEIYLRAGQLSWELIHWIIIMNPEPIPQQGDVTLFKRRKPDQSLLPTQGSIEKMYDHIRMVDASTYPLAFILHGEFRLEFSHAEIQSDEIHAQVVIRKTSDIVDYHE